VPGSPIVDPATDFTLVPDSSIIPLAAGNSAADTINLSSVNSFSGAVAFYLHGSVGDHLHDPTVGEPGQRRSRNNNVTISAAASTPLGSYDVLIVGKDSTGKYVHTLGLTAIVGVWAPLPKAFN